MEVLMIQGSETERFIEQIAERFMAKVNDRLTQENERPMTTKEAASHLSLHVNTLYKRMKEKGFPVHTDNGLHYFFASELNAHIKRKKK